MITAIVQFQLPEGLPLEEVREQFLEVAPAFRGVPGLVRKQFLLSQDGRTAGGAYLWQSLEAAEQFYEGGLREQIAARYGSEPTITFFETPVVVDNEAAA